MTPINSKLYDRLKFVAQILLPALGTLYVTLAGIWGLPASEQVGGTILALDTFLGALLLLSSTAYANSDEKFDGTVHMLDTTRTGRNFQIHLPLSAEEMEKKQEVLFKVEQPS